MLECQVNLDEIKKAYKDRLYEEEGYGKWLEETAKVNGYNS